MEVGASVGTGGEEQTLGGQAAPPVRVLRLHLQHRRRRARLHRHRHTARSKESRESGVLTETRGRHGVWLEREQSSDVLSQIRVDPKNPDTVYVRAA